MTPTTTALRMKFVSVAAAIIAGTPALVVLAVPLQAQTAAQAAAAVTEYNINGLKVLVKRRPGSLTVAAGLFIKGGSHNLTAENAGIEAVMLDAASEATLNFPRASLRDELSRMATGIGNNSNQDYSVLSLACTRANFERSWRIFTDVALHPAFTAEDVNLVRDRHLAALRSEADDPDSYLQLLEDRVVFAGHPYANRPAGNVEAVNRATPKLLRQYHDRLFTTSQLLLVVVGDLDPAAVRSLVAASLGKLPRGSYQPRRAPALVFTEPTLNVTSQNLPTHYVQGFFSAPAPDEADIYPMRIAMSILHDRVFEEVRVKRNLSYAPDAFLRTSQANVGGLYVTAVDANQAIRVMLNEVAKLQSSPVDADDIGQSLGQFLTNHYIAEETNGAQAGVLARYEIIGGGWRNADLFIPRLRTVTPAEVQRVAQKYMRNIRFVVLGDPAGINKQIFTGNGVQ
ncbi:MAG: insulinase family protein [Gemmatimonadaceae bacterium]|nr:insulinase family protein [Gemmatimonadaceae bacterium]